MLPPGVRRLFRLAIRPRDVRGEVDDEIRTHLELRVAKLIASGVAPSEAWDEARRRFGRPDDDRRSLYETATARDRRMRIREWIHDSWTDLRIGIRSLSREPGLATFVIAALALGIGANASMFGLVDRLMLRAPDHLQDANELRRLQLTRSGPTGAPTSTGRFGYVVYDLIRREAGSVARVATYSTGQDNVIYGRGPDARRINQGQATASLFPLLGVRPHLGRFYNEREDDPNDPERVAVLGYEFWRTQFGGERDVVGETITLNNAAYEVVGVAPRGFTGPELSRVDVWVPESVTSHSSNWQQSWNSWWLHVVMRTRPGVPDDRAASEITTLYRRAVEAAGRPTDNATLALRPITTDADGQLTAEARVSVWLFGVAVIVLVIACANVANLLLARTLHRRRELAVRLALGAGRGRVVRLLVVEAVALAGAGAVAGLAVAWALRRGLQSTLLSTVDWSGASGDARLIAASVAAAMIAAAAVVIVPALQASRTDLSSSLRTGAREGGGRRNRLRAGLTVLQAALSVLLLTGAGLFVRSLDRVRGLDLGVEPSKVISFRVVRGSSATIADTAERRRELVRRAAFYPLMMEELRARPDVEHVALSVGTPFGAGFSVDIRVPGYDSLPQFPDGGPFIHAVTAEYFATLGSRITAGRSFTAADRVGSEPVAIVNETMARALWPGEDPTTKCFFASYMSDDCARVVGVTVDARRFRVTEPRAMTFYVPLGQERQISGTELLIRAAGDPHRLMADVRSVLTAADPSILYVDAAVMQDRIDPQYRPWRLGATVFLLMGLLALAVASIGLYSVMSYIVASRRHEIGVRIALGARGRDIVGMILSGGMAMAAAGIAAGLALAWWGARFLEPLLFETPPGDPVVYALVATALLVVALSASIIPARRAQRVNPMDSLRTD